MNLIKKIILSTTIALAANAFAQDVPSFHCNDNTEQYSGILPDVCLAGSGQIGLGLQSDGTTATFYIWLHDIKLTKAGQSKVIRLFVDNNNQYFKDIQAIAQTAYVTRSIVSAHFHSPNINQTLCTDNGTTIDCPLISFGLGH